MCKAPQDAAVLQEQRRRTEELRIEEQQTDQLQQAQPQEQQQEREQEQEQQAQGIYGNLFRHFQPLPEGTPVAPGPAPAANLSYKERRRQKAEMKKTLKQNWEAYKGLDSSSQLLDARDVRNLPLFATQKGREKWAAAKLKHSNLTMGQTVEMVNRGDYSNFENLDGVMRNLTAGKALKKLMREYDVMGTPVDQLCRQIKQSGAGVSALLDPALRLGLSLAQRTDGYSDEMKARFRELDEAMSTEVMLETLTHQADQNAVAQDIRRKQAGLTEDQAQSAARKAIEANAAQQIQVAKRLLLLHLGNFQMVHNNGTSQDWDRPVAVALSHCSRVALTLPKLHSDSKVEKERDQRMWKSIFYQMDGSNPAQDNHRASSTHSIQRRETGGAGTREKKVPFNFIGQRGMNVAIGGLGNGGVSGKTLSNDGSCGHFYSMYKAGDATHYGAMLMGLESDCAGVTNQMGHTHDIKATGEKASSLGGQRADEVGRKYGGRVCDLSIHSSVAITGYMEALECAMKYWQNQPGGLGAGEAAEMMRTLTGRKISYDDFMTNVFPVLNNAAQAYRDMGGGA